MMKNNVSCPVKLKSITKIKKALPATDVPKFQSLHRNVGKEHMSLSNRQAYYRLAATAVLQDAQLVKEYVTHRIGLLLNQAPGKEDLLAHHRAALAPVLEKHSILKTQSE